MYDQETPLEVRKAGAAMEFGKAVKEFGLNQSPTFAEATKRMKDMDHGPNHSEGDPLEHSQLYVAELNSYIDEHAKDFTPEETRLLRLGGTLHDIGKAGTQKYDVVSGKQNKVVDATPDQIAEAQSLKLKLLSEVSGKSVDEIKALSGGKQKDLATQFEAELQPKLASMSKEFPALAANFRGHDKKSAEMGKDIVKESGVELSPEETKLLGYLLANHMDLLDWADLVEADLNDPKKVQGPMKIFETLFVEGEKGSRAINEKKIKMLLALTFADNASTYHKSESDGDREKAFARIVKVAEAFRAKTEPVLEKEAQDKKVNDILVAAFQDQGSLATYLAKEKGLAGKLIGEAANKVKEFVRANLGKDTESLLEEVRQFAQGL